MAAWAGDDEDAGEVRGYRVLTGPARGELEEKRSRFLCLLGRVETEEDARAFVDDARRAHPDARHHCSAYVLGTSAVERASDDGEPSGTAGAPMLEVLRGAGLGDTVAVVVRWFGGTLLGAGGLVRAYGDAVRVALDTAELAVRRERRLVRVHVSHAEAGRVENALRAQGLTVVDVAYGAAVALTFAVTSVETVAAEVAGLTGGVGRVEEAGTTWIDEPLTSPS